ncbi:MAG: hypothetical protein U1F30_06530 [Steroidobacteraceae bacterium]
MKPLKRSSAPLAALIAACLAALPGTAAAQSCHALEGTWVLQPGRGDLGSGLSFNPYYAITGVRLTLRQQGQRIEQQWHFTGPHVDRTVDYAFSADGTRQPTAVAEPMDFEYVAVAAEWQNCTLLLTGYSRLFGMEVRTTSTFVFSADGADLEIQQYGESPISVVDRRLVFQRVR